MKINTSTKSYDTYTDFRNDCAYYKGDGSGGGGVCNYKETDVKPTCKTKMCPRITKLPLRGENIPALAAGE